jgi:hypothetical protein
LLEAFFDQAIDLRPPHAHLDRGDDRQQSRAYQNQRQSSDSVFVDHNLDMDVEKRIKGRGRLLLRLVAGAATRPWIPFHWTGIGPARLDAHGGIDDVYVEKIGSYQSLAL